MTADASSPGAEHPLRELAPRVLGAVVKRYGDFAAAEDAVQEALLAAHVGWPRDGAPANPGGWLYRVACRRMEDHRNSEEARKERERAAGEPEGGASVPESHDDTLSLFFMCCHPELSPPSAIALTLRAVGGLTTAEIARAFLVPESTMAQRISRAKQAIASAGARFELPDARERESRLGSVLHALYLIFNEGYVASSGTELVRVELSSEAIRLARLLRRVEPGHGEAAGLLALLLLTDARRRARTGPEGELVPLHEQDRSLWDRAAILEGTALVTEAMAKGSVGSYQIQAAIAALHDEAPSVVATDWPQILALYGLLERMSDNPMVALNRAVAAAMVHGPGAGLGMIDRIEEEGKLDGHYRLDAVRAHLHELSGDLAAAVRCYRAAADRTASEPERHYLLTKLRRLARG